MAVQGLERLTCEEADPEERRHVGLGDVLAGAASNLEVSVLEHVGRVDAPLQPPVEAEADHAPQALAVPGEESVRAGCVPPFEAAEQIVIIARFSSVMAAPIL